jgi:hypothetical protein
MEGLSLIDVSAEDDLLFDLATPPPAQAPPRHPDPTQAGERFHSTIHFGENFFWSIGGIAGLAPFGAFLWI